MFLNYIFSSQQEEGGHFFRKNNLQLALALTTHSELRKLKNFTPRT